MWPVLVAWTQAPCARCYLSSVLHPVPKMTKNQTTPPRKMAIKNQKMLLRVTRRTRRKKMETRNLMPRRVATKRKVRRKVTPRRVVTRRKKVGTKKLTPKRAVTRKLMPRREETKRLMAIRKRMHPRNQLPIRPRKLVQLRASAMT